jgi:AcrR family transcriptional regulator
MARPSLKEQRTAQILDAFETCVAKYGVEGATLERIADEAGLSRPLIRHNVGNRQDLIDTLADRFSEQSASAIANMIDMLPRDNRARALIEILFDSSYSNAKLVLVSQALIVASASDARLASRMKEWVVDFIAEIEGIIEQEFPDASPVAIGGVAAGLTGIYFNVEAFTPLGAMPSLEASSKAAAIRLLASLDTEIEDV